MLICQICGYSHELMISPSHLKKHNISGPEYKLRFPGHALRIQSPSTKLKMSLAKAGNIAWNKGIKTGPNEKISLSKKGTINLKLKGQKRTSEQCEKISLGTKTGMIGVMTDEIKNKLKKSIALKKEAGLFIPGMLGKAHSDKTKALLSAKGKISQEKRSDIALQKIINIATDKNITINSIEDNYIIDMTCNTCFSSFTFTRQIFRPSVSSQEKICPHCYPRTSGRSEQELQFFNAIKSIEDTAIANDRIILGGKEIDVFLPNKNIGFEYTGLYWHAEKQNPKQKHLLWKQQFALKRGVKLYTVFEDEWLHSPELVISKVAEILKISKNIIHAQECIIKELDVHECNIFLELNHLSGKKDSSFSLGLYSNNNLVAVAAFKETTDKKNELLTYCQAKNFYITEGAKTLISVFMHQYNTLDKDLVSYSDNRWSYGEFYKDLGFKRTKLSSPKCWYISNYKSRNELMPLCTDKIWDCGYSEWLLKA